jgi:hypothetical protein
MLVRRGPAGVHSLPFPARSPDIAVVETLWADVVRRLDTFCMQSRRWCGGVKNTLANRAAWNRLVLRVCRETRPAFAKSLVLSMGGRVARVIAKGGGPTRW